MTQTQRGRANYLIWKYNYNENGMKNKEVVYNKQKEFLGKIEYTYPIARRYTFYNKPERKTKIILV
jgi:hypothetical protein